MTEAPQPNRDDYEAFRADYGEVAKLNKVLENQGHPDKNKKNQTREDIRKYANKIAKLIPGYNKSPEDMSGEEVEKGVKDGIDLAIERAGRNLETIIDEQIPAKNLEKLINSKAIVEHASEKDSPALQETAEYARLKSLKELYEKSGQVRTKEELEMIQHYAQVGAMEAQREALKDYSKDLQERGAAFAALALRSGSISEEKRKEYILKGIAKELKEYAPEKAEKAREAVKSTLKSLYKGSAKEAQTAMDLIYQSGEKDS